jgi:antitoxin (DNA-binding transcriptional repressor) of toxin-antitoxin stability system
MKAIKVSELKMHLSRYLRMASRGTQILVQDRDEPLAQLGPPQGQPTAWRDRLAQQGRLKLGRQDWDELVISPLPQSIDAQAALAAVRDDR